MRRKKPLAVRLRRFGNASWIWWNRFGRKLALCFLLPCICILLLLQFTLSRAPATASTKRFGYVALLCDDQMAEATAVLVYSVKKTKTPHDFVVMTMPAVTGDTVTLLRSLGALVRGIQKPVPYPFAIRANRLAINKPCRYSKLKMWSLVEYRKLVYLDVDMLVLDNIDELFSRPELSAVPDSVPPDTFNSGLMVLEPNMKTYQDMIARVNSTPSPNVGDQGFLNEYFMGWYSKGPSHHLHYGYNALVRNSQSEAWNTWVAPKLKVIHFSGAGKPWNMRMDQQQVTIRNYDHIWWEMRNEMYKSVSIANASQKQLLDPSCQTNFMKYTHSSNSSRAYRFSVLLDGRGALPALLHRLLRHYDAMRAVVHIFLLLARTDGPHGERKENEIHETEEEEVRGTLVKALKLRRLKKVRFVGAGGVNDRVQPIARLETDAVLLCTADVEIDEPALVEAVEAWSENKYRLVGFYAASHWGEIDEDLRYVSSPRGLYSMVLTRALFMHADYLRAYSCNTPKTVLSFVAETPQCFDVAFNLVVAQLNGLTPLLMAYARKKDYSPHTNGLRFGARMAAHLLAQDGTACLNITSHLLGHMQLQHTGATRTLFEGNAFQKQPSLDPPPPHTPGGGLAPHKEGEEREGGGEGNRSGGSWQTSEKSLSGDFAEEEEEVENMSMYFTPVYTGMSELEGNDQMLLSNLEWPSREFEIAVAPSLTDSAESVLCLRGNATAPAEDKEYSNEHVLVEPVDIPEGSRRLSGTTYMVLSQSPLLDRPRLLCLLKQLLHHSEDSGGFGASRVVMFHRGALLTSIPAWHRDMTWALTASPETFQHLRPPLGSLPFALPDNRQLHCFERTVAVRSCEPFLKLGLLPRLRERVRLFCASQALVPRLTGGGGTTPSVFWVGGRGGGALLSSGRADAGEAGEDEPNQTTKEVKAGGGGRGNPGTASLRKSAPGGGGQVRVLVLASSENGAGAEGAFGDSRDLARHLALNVCHAADAGRRKCHAGILVSSPKHRLCNEVAAVQSEATILVGARGEALHSLVHLMPSGSVVIEVTLSSSNRTLASSGEQSLNGLAADLGVQLRTEVIMRANDQGSGHTGLMAALTEVATAVEQEVDKLVFKASQQKERP